MSLISAVALGLSSDYRYAYPFIYKTASVKFTEAVVFYNDIKNFAILSAKIR